MVSARNTALIHSAFFNIGSVCFGLALGIIGPTLLDLGEIYGVDTSEISRVYTVRSIGILVGSAIASFGLKIGNPGSVLIATLLVEAVFVTLVPLFSQLWLVYAAFFALGAAMALYEAYSNVVLASLWKNPTLQLQIYRLGYGFGTFVIPLVAAPFLSSRDAMDLGKLQHASASRIYLPYAGIGALCAILGICMMTFSYFVALPLRAEAEDNENVETLSDGAGDRESKFDAFEIVMAYLLCSFIFFAVSVELTFTGLITPFVVRSQLHMDKVAGALIGGVFRSTFFVGRILTVICHKLSLRVIMLVSLSILFLSSIVLSLFALMSPAVVWLASAGLGLGLSTLFGTSIAWTCQYIPLKHWHMALLMVATCMGASSPTFLVGWIESDPMLLMYVMVGLSVILSAVFGCMMLLVRGRGKSSTKGKN